VHPLRHYVQLFEQAGMPASKHAERNLKRWIAAGREQEPEDLPPFDDLADLEGWWGRCMTWRCPDWVKGLASTAAKSTAAAAVPAAASSSADRPAAAAANGDQAPALPQLAEIRIGADESADDGVRIFQAVVSDTIRRMNEAARLGAHKEYNRLTSELGEQLETLRKQKAAALKMAEATGEALRVRVLTAESVGSFTVLSYSFTNALMTVVEKLAPAMPAAARRSLVLPLRDGVFAHLRKTRYREAWDVTKKKLDEEPAWNSLASAS
jgi:hypothetical protein